MHELSVTQSMLELVLKQAEENNASKVEKINIVIGHMTGIVDECVKFYFDFLSKGTIAEGAELSVQTLPTQAECRDCGEKYEVGELDWSCPSCGSLRIKMVSGKELYVESIEVE